MNNVHKAVRRGKLGGGISDEDRFPDAESGLRTSCYHAGFQHDEKARGSLRKDQMTATATTALPLLDTVIAGGYCVGCGACASRPEAGFQMQFDDFGRLQARPVGDPDPTAAEAAAAVCPFADGVPNEDALNQAFFGPDLRAHDQIGRYLKTYAGYVAEDDFRARGSSGGMGTWILIELLKRGLIDGAAVVAPRRPTEDDPRLFSFTLARSAEAIRAAAKSRYYPIEMSEVVKTIRETPGRYAFVGIPCYVKAVRLLQRQDPVIRERVAYCVGLVCGHLKSTAFGAMQAWAHGIPPAALREVDFRHKLPDSPANRYGFRAVGLLEAQEAERVAAVADTYGTDWGMGFFKYQACDYCDDVLAETADLVVGDAWLPEYVADSRGTNVVVARRGELVEIVEAARAAGRLALEEVSADAVARSQSAGLRHRRDGLAYRLHLARKRWHPPKRVRPDPAWSRPAFRKQHRLRMKLAAESHVAFKLAKAAGDFAVFTRRMDPLIARYHRARVAPLWKRVGSRVKRAVLRLAGRGR